MREVVLINRFKFHFGDFFLYMDASVACNRLLWVLICIKHPATISQLGCVYILK